MAIITAFQPSASGQTDVVLELSVRQQGQVLLSALWAIIGLAGLIVALRRDVDSLRYAALILLLATVAKVFMYDLSTLTSIYRVLSCLVLGAFLLAGAFTYQRMRPPAPPDLRTVHPSLALVWVLVDRRIGHTAPRKQASVVDTLQQTLPAAASVLFSSANATPWSVDVST